MKKILVTIPVREKDRKFLEEKGKEFQFCYRTKEEITVSDVVDAEIILGNIPVELVPKAKKLKFLQLDSAGSTEYTASGVLMPDTKLANATGAYGLAISEYMLAGVLMLRKKLHLYQKNMEQHLWKDEGEVLSIRDSVTLVVGLGDIGSQFAEKMQIPVVTTIMGKGAIPTGHPLYVGNSGMHGKYAANMAVSKCDVLFSIGTRFNDRITGDLNEFAPKAKIVHIDVDTAAISRNVVVDVPIVSDANLALEKLLEWAESKDTAAWQAQIAGWDEKNPLEMRRDHGMTPQMIFEHVNRTFGEAVYVTDVGQHQMWATQYLELDSWHQLITSGGLGTMGFGLPAAIGAKIGNPDKEVVCFSGDGGLQMNIQEMATAVVQEAPVIICLFNNYYLGMVRQMQQLFYGKRYEATCLRRRKGCPANCKGPNASCPPYTPDFIALAKSYGAHGIRVEREDDIQAALDEARTYKDAPTIIEFMIATDEIVLPMVKSGNPMSEMILK